MPLVRLLSVDLSFNHLHAGQLRPIASAHLTTILELLLNYLVSLSLPHEQADAEELASALADEHEIPRQVSAQVMSWFGEVKNEKWTMNVDAVMKEVGLSILRYHKVVYIPNLHQDSTAPLTLLLQDDPIQENEFIERWKKAVGDTFESSVALGLLSVGTTTQFTDEP